MGDGVDSSDDLIEHELDSFDEGTATKAIHKDHDDRSPLISKESKSRSRCCSIYRVDAKDKSFCDRIRKMARSLSRTLRNPYNYLIGIWGFCSCSVSYHSMDCGWCRISC